MYVTDRLYLSLRITPDPDQPAIELLPSDTKIEVLRTAEDWAEVKLEDGGLGWVLKRFLVEDMPKSLTIEALKRQLEDKDAVLKKLEKEIATLKRQIEEQATLEAKEAALRKKIEVLEDQIAAQTKSFETTAKEHARKMLEGVSFSGIAALVVGITLGYLLGRRKKTHLSSSHL